MSEPKRCPQCQSAIPAGAPESLCPVCLLQAGLQSSAAPAEPRTTPYHGPAAAFVPPTPAELQPIFPQLEILALLGKGGMGAVYKARQPRLDRLVAIKILPAEFSRDPTFVERFDREARALAKLNHPHIVGIYDFGQADGYCFFIMEYVEGVNLHQAMREGNLTASEALKIVPQICDALQFAHDEGVVHRDIKPENILLDKKGRVKIADFGLAKLMGKEAPDVSLTGTQQVMGTLNYMAPEQLEGARDVDHRADIYSLGVTFYEMLTGELPLGRFAPPSQKVQIDVRLDEVVLRALERKPEQRYQHASEIKSEMDTIAGSAAPAAQRVGVARRPSYLRMAVMPLLAWIALLGMVYGSLVLFKPEDPDQIVRVATPFSGLVETSTPERYFVAQGGSVVGFLLLLVLSAVWLYWGAGPGVRLALLMVSAILGGLISFLVLTSAWGYAFTVALLLAIGLFLNFGSLVAAGYALAAIWREWWQSDSPFVLKCLRSVLLIVSVACLALLTSFFLSGGPGQQAEFRLGVPQPWLTYSTAVGEGFRLSFFSLSTLLLIVGWLAFWAYHRSFVATKRVERMPMSWTWRTLLMLGIGFWTFVCFVLFHVFWLPANVQINNGMKSGELDNNLWPYHGVSKCEVSVIPSEPIYARLIIQEEAAARRLGFHEGNFRLYEHPSGLTQLTYTLQLEPNPERVARLKFFVKPDPTFVAKQGPAKVLPNVLEVDALDNFRWRYTTESGVERSGPLLDANVINEWLCHFTPGTQVAEEKILAHAGVLMGILRDAANDDRGRPVQGNNNKLVSRLHHEVAMTQRSLQNSHRPEDRQTAFRSWNASDHAKWEPEVPILYVGLPLMLAVWIGGMGLMYLAVRGKAVTA